MQQQQRQYTARRVVLPATRYNHGRRVRTSSPTTAAAAESGRFMRIEFVVGTEAEGEGGRDGGGVSERSRSGRKLKLGCSSRGGYIRSTSRRSGGGGCRRSGRINVRRQCDRREQIQSAVTPGWPPRRGRARRRLQSV